MVLESNHIENEWTIRAYVEALEAWDYIRTLKHPMSAVWLRDTHSILMESRDTIKDAWKGVYRTVSVFVRIPGEAQPKPFMVWKDVPAVMDKLFEDLNRDLEASWTPHDREAWAKELHVRFETIHPFADGNGRVGRLLYNWHRLRMGLPIHVIEYREREQYYAWFE